MARALYRSRQVLHALRPRIDAADLALARELLTPSQAGLFFAMEKRDQRHCLAVASKLRAAGASDPTLLTAALLHDCGKGAVPVWLRILNVLAPPLVERLGSDSAAGWRAAAYRLAHHVRLSGELASRVGSSDAVVRLIEGRVLPYEQSLLAQLVAADDAS